MLPLAGVVLRFMSGRHHRAGGRKALSQKALETLPEHVELRVLMRRGLPVPREKHAFPQDKRSVLPVVPRLIIADPFSPASFGRWRARVAVADPGCACSDWRTWRRECRYQDIRVDEHIVAGTSRMTKWNEVSSVAIRIRGHMSLHGQWITGPIDVYATDNLIGVPEFVRTSFPFGITLLAHT